MSESFICASCGGSFIKSRSEEEVEAEFHKNFPEDSIENTVIICDGCYQRLLGVK